LAVKTLQQMKTLYAYQPDMLSIMVKNWIIINKLAILHKKPFAFRISSKGKM